MGFPAERPRLQSEEFALMSRKLRSKNGIKTERVTIFEMATPTARKTSTRVTIVTEMIRMGPTFHLKNREVDLRDCGGSMARIEDML